MKVRNLVTSTALAVALTGFSANSFANSSGSENIVTAIAASFVKSAVQTTIYEINNAIKQDVLTTSHHFETDMETPVMVAKVEIKDIKNEG